MKNVSHSASHLSWCFKGRIDSLNKEFEFETGEMVKFRFSFETGLITSKIINPLLSEGNLRVYGKIERTKIDTVFTMEICGLIYGKMPLNDTIKFTISKGEKKYFKFSRYDYKVIFIRNNIYIKSTLF